MGTQIAAALSLSAPPMAWGAARVDAGYTREAGNIPGCSQVRSRALCSPEPGAARGPCPGKVEERGQG